MTSLDSHRMVSEPGQDDTFTGKYKSRKPTTVELGNLTEDFLQKPRTAAKVLEPFLEEPKAQMWQHGRILTKSKETDNPGAV